MVKVFSAIKHTLFSLLGVGALALGLWERYMSAKGYAEWIQRLGIEPGDLWWVSPVLMAAVALWSVYAHKVEKRAEIATLEDKAGAADRERDLWRTVVRQFESVRLNSQAMPDALSRFRERCREIVEGLQAIYMTDMQNDERYYAAQSALLAHQQMAIFTFRAAKDKGILSADLPVEEEDPFRSWLSLSLYAEKHWSGDTPELSKLGSFFAAADIDGEAQLILHHTRETLPTLRTQAIALVRAVSRRAVTPEQTAASTSSLPSAVSQPAAPSQLHQPNAYRKPEV